MGSNGENENNWNPKVTCCNAAEMYPERMQPSVVEPSERLKEALKPGF